MMRSGDTSSEFDEVKSVTQDALKEIMRLTNWYWSYISAYEELETQYERANEFEMKLLHKTQELEKWLNEQYKEELKRRAAFEPQKFLPPELVAPLKKPPTIYKIVPSPNSVAKMIESRKTL